MRKTQRAKITVSEKDRSELVRISKSRVLPHREVVRATILLKYMEGRSISSIARDCRTNRPLVERCIDKVLAFGALAALKDLPGRGTKPGLATKKWTIS